MSKLYSLAYISKNRLQGSKEEVEAEIVDILAKAHKNNPDLGVTGALLYSGGYFCQVIEGDDEALEELFETIQGDDRHGEITILHFEPIEKRVFSEWSMAFAGIEAAMRFDIEGIKQSKNELQMQEAGKEMVDALDSLVKQHQQVFNPD